jgi:hypothetical protein
LHPPSPEHTTNGPGSREDSGRRSQKAGARASRGWPGLQRWGLVPAFTLPMTFPRDDLCWGMVVVPAQEGNDADGGWGR